MSYSSKSVSRLTREDLQALDYEDLYSLNFRYKSMISSGHVGSKRLQEECCYLQREIAIRETWGQTSDRPVWRKR